jgi:hypothetical protein
VLNGRQFSATHVFQAAGVYNGTITARDNDGLQAVPLSFQVEVFAGFLPASVVNYHVFYNNSFWDTPSGANPGGNDNTAIADKTALLPGGHATFANYTTYSKGLNGIFLDVEGLVNPGGLTTDDFIFRTGNNDNPSGWGFAPNPLSISVEMGAGTDDSDRIKIIWADNDLDGLVEANEAVAKGWLQVTLKATANTGLLADEVHYWGNAPGESGNSTANAIVNLTDVAGARSNQTGFGFATIVNPYDFNRDRRVNLTDVALARGNQSGFTPLRLINPPAFGGGSTASFTVDAFAVPSLAATAMTFSESTVMETAQLAALPVSMLPTAVPGQSAATRRDAYRGPATSGVNLPWGPTGQLEATAGQRRPNWNEWVDLAMTGEQEDGPSTPWCSTDDEWLAAVAANAHWDDVWT